MAVVVAAEDVGGDSVSLQHAKLRKQTVSCKVTDEQPPSAHEMERAVIADVSREFLSSNGAEKHARAYVTVPNLMKDDAAPTSAVAAVACGTYKAAFKLPIGDLNIRSQNGGLLGTL